jgi:hypothetical protein
MIPRLGRTPDAEVAVVDMLTRWLPGYEEAPWLLDDMQLRRGVVA